MTEVLVSVVMPSYNCEEYISEAIESILFQTYVNFEFIIINDGSTDQTDSIIRSFSDKRIKYISYASNSGIVYALNLGIKASKGDYVLRMDADDIALPNRIELQVSFMIANPLIDISGCKALFFEQDSPNITSIHGALLNSHSVIKVLLFLYSPYVHPTIIFNNSIKNKEYLYYSEDCNYGDDYELFTRNIDHFVYGYLDQIVLKYRVHHSINRLTNSSKISKYKSSTLKTRLKYFSIHFPQINYKLISHYEDLFYNDAQISLVSLKKTILFYLKFKEAVSYLNANEIESDYINKQINNSFYNSIYRFSKIGFSSFILYYKYSKNLGRFQASKESKFFIKSLLKK